MSKHCQFAAPRYVLVARDVENKRLAVCSTPRSLVDLAGLLKSLFALNPATVVVDVLLAWPAGQGQKVDDQEVLLQAERYSGDGPGTFIWYRVRDLRAIEQDIAARAAVLADAELEVTS
jgi:hypothetical protein